MKKHRSERVTLGFVVPELVKSKTMELVGDDEAVHCKGCFMKLPMEDDERPSVGLFNVFKQLEKDSFSKKKFSCRSNTEAPIVAAVDGDRSCYMNIGSTVNKHGKGVVVSQHPVLETPAFIEWLNQVGKKVKSTFGNQ